MDTLATIAAFLALLPPATREQILVTAEKHDFERFGPGQGVINAVILTFNVAQHRTLSGYEIASMATATNYTERQIKKQRKNVSLSLELPVYQSIVAHASHTHFTISGVVNRVVKASGIYRPGPIR